MIKKETILVALFDDCFMELWGNKNFEELGEEINGEKKYSWESNGTLYEFLVEKVYNNQIEKGILQDIQKKYKYCVLILGGTDQAINLYLWKNVNPSKLTRWKNNVDRFVKNGGGYIGHCFGTIACCELENVPETITERMVEGSSIGITDTKVYTHTAFPLLHQLNPRSSPGRIGDSSYVYYSGFNPESETTNLGGASLDFDIEDLHHPFFKNYHDKTIRITWISGPALIPSKKAEVLLRYPSQEISDSHGIKQWKFIGTGIGGPIGKLNGLIKSIIREINPDAKLRRILRTSLREMTTGKLGTDGFIERIYKHFGDEEKALDAFEKIYLGILKATDWRKLSRNIKTDFAGKAAMITETHGKGRIVLSGPHPEDIIWYGGRIVNQDTKENSLWDGLYHWDDYEIKGKPNYWLLCREVAWAAGLDEDNLPPIKREQNLMIISD